MTTWIKSVFCFLLLGCMFIGASTAQSSVTITYWSWEDVESIISKFELLHPGIKVEFTKLGPWDLHDKFLVSLAAGTGGPDVAELVTRRFSSFMETEALVDITGKVKELEKDFVPSAWEMVQYKGKVYGLPVGIGPGVVWYRKDLFTQSGIQMPMETWEDYINAGKKLKTAGTYLLPIFVPAGQWGGNSFTLMLHSRGGNIFTREGKFIHDNELLVDTLQWYVDLYRKHKVADTLRFFTPEFQNRLKIGEFASWPMNMCEGIMSMPKYMPELAGKWNVMPFLRWKEREVATTGIWGATVFTTPNHSKNEDEALTFMMYITSTTDGGVSWGKYIGDFPVYIPAQKHPFFKEVHPYYGKCVWDQVLPIPPFYYFDWAETMQILGRQLDELFVGRITAEEAYDNMRDEIRKKLER